MRDDEALPLCGIGKAYPLWITPQSVAKNSQGEIFAISYDAGSFRIDTPCFSTGRSIHIGSFYTMVYKFIERSKGVVVFAVSLIFFGGFSTFLLILSLALISLKDIIPSVAAVMPYGMLSMPVFWISSLFNLLIFISWVITGIGVLHLREWARQYLRIVMSIYFINMIVNIFLNVFLAQEVAAQVPLRPLLIGILIVLFYYLSVIYFFSHPNIVRQFKFKSREY